LESSAEKQTEEKKILVKIVRLDDHAEEFRFTARRINKIDYFGRNEGFGDFLHFSVRKDRLSDLMDRADYKELFPGSKIFMGYNGNDGWNLKRLYFANAWVVEGKTAYVPKDEPFYTF
jgi:hypothetical protein